MIDLISINYKWLLSVDQAFCESYTCKTKNPLSAMINRSIRRLNGGSSAELFRYTIVTQVYGVSYGGWIPKEEFEKTNFVKILQLI